MTWDGEGDRASEMHSIQIRYRRASVFAICDISPRSFGRYGKSFAASGPLPSVSRIYGLRGAQIHSNVQPALERSRDENTGTVKKQDVNRLGHINLQRIPQTPPSARSSPEPHRAAAQCSLRAYRGGQNNGESRRQLAYYRGHDGDSVDRHFSADDNQKRLTQMQ